MKALAKPEIKNTHFRPSSKCGKNAILWWKGLSRRISNISYPAGLALFGEALPPARFLPLRNLMISGELLVLEDFILTAVNNGYNPNRRLNGSAEARSGKFHTRRISVKDKVDAGIQ
ncbi:MAG: hypothetical protein ACM3JB_24020 [Acidobacteriaceae bacterium]